MRSPHTLSWAAVCTLFAACVGPAPVWAGLIASNALESGGAALLGGGVTTSAPAAPDPARTGSFGASVSAGKNQNDEWFNVIVLGGRPGPAGDMPSPLLSTGTITRPSVLAVLADWTTPLLRVSLDEMASGPPRAPVNLIAPENTLPLPSPGGE